MIISYYYGPRTIGKTTQALEIYRSDPDRNVLFVKDTRQFNSFDLYCKNKPKSNIFSYGEKSKVRYPKEFNTVILDEFDFAFTSNWHKSDFIKSISSNVKEVVIFTTPTYLRDKIEYMVCRSLNDFCSSWDDIKGEYPEIEADKDFLMKLEDLRDDPITWNNVNLHKMKVPEWCDLDRRKAKSYLSDEQYKTEVEGKLFK